MVVGVVDPLQQDEEHLALAGVVEEGVFIALPQHPYYFFENIAPNSPILRPQLVSQCFEARVERSFIRLQ